MIIGTAGHVDHGKTTLIKKLTGMDTDRLKEEKKRGITIELGFAQWETENGESIGIVDVPGHEKFLHNMLAGVGGIDVAMLVIAADEGIMPQTQEHLDIIESLNISQGIVVITKKDLVEADWLEMVFDEVKDFVKGTVFCHEEPIAVSSHTGENIKLLEAKINRLVQGVEEKNQEKQVFRLPVDRVFTVDGFGTVITGTLKEGTVNKGDKIEIYPSREEVKVRNIQVHGKEVTQAVAGQRTAMNITGMKKELIEKGQVLAYPGSLENAWMVDALIRVFPKSKRNIVNGSRVHFHYGTHQVIGKVILLDRDQLEPGEQGYAQIRLEENVALKKEDPFILRFLSPLETIAGGRIIDPCAKKHKRYRQDVITSLEVKNKGDAMEVIEQMVKDHEPDLSSKSSLAMKSSLNTGELERVLSALIEEKELIPMGEEELCHRTYERKIYESIEKLLAEYHQAFPLSPGMDKAEFQSKLAQNLFRNQKKSTSKILAYFLNQGDFIENQGVIYQKSFSLTLTREQEAQKEAILDYYLRMGFQVPQVDDLKSYGPNTLDFLRLLEKEGQLVKLKGTFYMEKDTYEQGVDFVKEHTEKQGALKLSTMRDYTQTSRKYTLIFLEALDEKKLTQLVGEERHWIGNPG